MMYSFKAVSGLPNVLDDSARRRWPSAVWITLSTDALGSMSILTETMSSM